MEDQDYEDDELSHASLSSGLSPRESRPRTRPWDLAEGYQVCITRLCLYTLKLVNVANAHVALNQCLRLPARV